MSLKGVRSGGLALSVVSGDLAAAANHMWPVPTMAPPAKTQFMNTRTIMNSQPTSFFGALFDFSFREFITPKIVSVIFVLLTVLSAVYALAAFVALLAGPGFFIAIIVAPVIFIISVILNRVGLEIAVALFRIAQNTSDIARNTRGNAQP